MKTVKDFRWQPGMTAHEFMQSMSTVGFQSIELAKAKDCFVRMKKEGAKIYLAFTSNMVTSGLRGFFAQLIELGMVDVVSTTVGGIEEDIMKAMGEKFTISTFHADDVALHEQGMNRVGNLLISNESYAKFESFMLPVIQSLYAKNKRFSGVELLSHIGSTLNDENSFLYQAHKKNIPVFCPALTDGSFGFHLFMFQQKHKDMMLDIVNDFSQLISATSFDDKKALIALGGGISKHHAMLGMLLNGGCDYAVYMTTARTHSGSISGATTQEAKSWGKIKDDADAATVIGEVSVLFPLAMIAALEELKEDGTIAA